MHLKLEKYLIQIEEWPNEGRQILAQYDQESIIVYQAYRPSIGYFASQNKFFGGEFSLSRMSWIKPNFLWMMYRSGWASKEGQEVILAIKLKRSGFEEILSQAVHSSFQPKIWHSQADWQKALKRSDVRLQWDPDHSPTGNKLERRAIQLGLSGKILSLYAKEWIIDIEDISDFVKAQHQNASKPNRNHLITPIETIYPLSDDLVFKLGASKI